jgi:hypothetical protein
MIMTTDEALEKCARELPKKYSISAYIENGYKCVTWTSPSDVARQIDIGEASMAEAIIKALERCHEYNKRLINGN